MSRKIDHFISELIAEDMVDINKLKKNDLKDNCSARITIIIIVCNITSRLFNSSIVIFC